MSKRDAIKTKKCDIIDYWSTRVDDYDMGAEQEDWATHCWRCGCKRKLQRCHIIPDCHGGPDDPSNYVLLCFECHEEAPATTNPGDMWDWIKETRVMICGTFWQTRAFDEFVRRYGSIETLVETGKLESFCRDKVAMREAIAWASKDIGSHFGRGGYSTASRVMIYKKFFQRVAEYQGPTSENSSACLTPPPKIANTKRPKRFGLSPAEQSILDSVA